MIILDTSILILILRKKPKGYQWKEYLIDKSVAFTTITSFELFLGAELSKKRESNIKAIQNLVQEFMVLPFTIKSSFISAGIFYELQKKGQMIELNDIYIAAIALEHNALLATDNIDHFNRIDNLKIVDNYDVL